MIIHIKDTDNNNDTLVEQLYGLYGLYGLYASFNNCLRNCKADSYEQRCTLIIKWILKIKYLKKRFWIKSTQSMCRYYVDTKDVTSY